VAKGACMCGKICFEISGEPLLCHCLDCKRLTGTAYSTKHHRIEIHPPPPRRRAETIHLHLGSRTGLHDRYLRDMLEHAVEGERR
ncbi:hypothetical protein CC80DRAFT_401211, partial [Byssothecium circinans]